VAAPPLISCYLASASTRILLWSVLAGLIFLIGSIFFIFASISVVLCPESLALWS
jgi:hypothetical protein